MVAGTINQQSVDFFYGWYYTKTKNKIQPLNLLFDVY